MNLMEKIKVTLHENGKHVVVSDKPPCPRDICDIASEKTEMFIKKSKRVADRLGALLEKGA